MAQLTHDAETVLVKITAKQAAGEKLTADTAALVASIQEALKQRHLAGLRRLLESVTVVQNYR